MKCINLQLKILTYLNMKISKQDIKILKIIKHHLVGMIHINYHLTGMHWRHMVWVRIQLSRSCCFCQSPMDIVLRGGAVAVRGFVQLCEPLCRDALPPSPRVARAPPFRCLAVEYLLPTVCRDVPARCPHHDWCVDGYKLFIT